MEQPPEFLIKTLLDHSNSDLRPLNANEMKVFVMLSLSEKNALQGDMKKYMHWDKPIEEQVDVGVQQICKHNLMGGLLFDRLVGLNTPEMLVTTHLFVWLSFLSDRPRVAVLWTPTLYRMWLAIPIEMPISLWEWSIRFNAGTPSDQFYHDCWRGQKNAKAPNKNVLDSPDYWQWLKTQPRTIKQGTTSE